MPLLFILAIALCQSSMAAQSFGSFLSGYAPFLDGRPWPRLPLVTYVSSSNAWAHPASPRNFPTVRLRYDDDSDFTTVVLRLPNGREFKTYCDAAPSPFAEEVYSADLNGDGTPDFIIVKPGSGCGMCAEYCTGVFAFSEQDHYRFTRVTTMGLGQHSLLVDPKTKAFRFVHTSFRAGKTTDGRYHSFWVHRFFEWNGVAFQEDPKLAPVWIQYLYRENHDPTKLLTSTQKGKIWAEDHENARIDW